MPDDTEARFWRRYLRLGGMALGLGGLALFLKAHELPGFGVAFSLGFLLAVVTIVGVWVRVLRQLRR